MLVVDEKASEKELSISIGKGVFEYLLKMGKGRMTIQEFDRVEQLIRPYMRSAHLRCYYRGPRIHNKHQAGVKPSMTMRRDAKYVVFGAV